MVPHRLDSLLPAFAPVAITPVSTTTSETNATSHGQRTCCPLCTGKPPLASTCAHRSEAQGTFLQRCRSIFNVPNATEDDAGACYLRFWTSVIPSRTLSITETTLSTPETCSLKSLIASVDSSPSASTTRPDQRTLSAISTPSSARSG